MSFRTLLASAWLVAIAPVGLVSSLPACSTGKESGASGERDVPRAGSAGGGRAGSSAGAARGGDNGAGGFAGATGPKADGQGASGATGSRPDAATSNTADAHISGPQQDGGVAGGAGGASDRGGAGGAAGGGEAGAEGTAPVKLFLDTDTVVDAGDMAALAFMHGLADRCEIEILGVTAVTTLGSAGACVDAVNRYYGRPDIPVGVLKDKEAFLDHSTYGSDIASRFPSRYAASNSAPDATTIFRQVVAKQPDKSVVLVAIGPLRNISRFIDSKPDEASPLSGRELIAKKVKVLSSMAGVFKDGVDAFGGIIKTEWNIEQDVPSAQHVTETLGVPIMFSGFEIGWYINSDGPIVSQQPDSPVSIALKSQGGGRPAWDQTSLLYGARGLADLWQGELKGRVEVYNDKRNAWKADPDRQQGFLKQKASSDAVSKIIDQIQADAGLNGRCRARTGNICTKTPEGESLTLTCPTGRTIKSIVFASFGVSQGVCGKFATGACHATNSSSVVSTACVGKPTCNIPVGTAKFGDPCSGADKTLAVEASCGL